MRELINCSQCEGKISVLAKMICPHCGCLADIALKPESSANTSKADPQKTTSYSKGYEVAATDNTKPYRHIFGKNGFGLKWEKKKTEWRGELESEKFIFDFIKFCEENSVGYEVPPEFLDAYKRKVQETRPPDKSNCDQVQIPTVSNLPPSNISPETASFLDNKNKYGKQWERKAEEGISGSREDWKKNRGGYSGDMGYGKPK